MKTTMLGRGWNSPGQNRGAIWTINQACRVRGYDMDGVDVRVPLGYRLDRFPDGFDVVSPIGRLWNVVRRVFPVRL